MSCALQGLKVVNIFHEISQPGFYKIVCGYIKQGRFPLREMLFVQRFGCSQRTPLATARLVNQPLQDS